MVSNGSLIHRILSLSERCRKNITRCKDRCTKARLVAFRLLSALVFLAPAAQGQAQGLVAGDDAYGVPFGEDLVAEAPGVLANDTFNGDPAEDHGATAELIGDVSFGYLSCESNVAFELCPDGSFIYTPYPEFPGTDIFTYRVTVGTDTALATVTLSACSAGPGATQTVCWKERPYLTKLGELGYQLFQEGFESETAWGSVREASTALSVLSQGVEWQTNHRDPPALNEITTGTGPSRTGLYGVFDPLHCYALGIPAG